MSRTKSLTLGSLVILLGTLVVYWPAIRAGFIWDDDQYVLDNRTLRDASGLVDIWFHPTSIPQWYPLVHTTFWIEYHLWGVAPLGYHLDNVLLHIASAFLLWRLLTKLQVPGAWLAAAIFAVHPVGVESVAWVTERKNVLSGVFALLSLLNYLEWTGSEGKNSWRIYALALLFFVAALLSKTVVATLPAAILVIFWWKRGRIRWADVVPLIPFFVVGIGLGIVTAYLEVHKVGASGEHIFELRLSALQRALIAGRAICFYARKLVAPWPLVFIYPQWQNIDPAVWWQWVFPLVVVAVIVALVLSRKRIGRGPAAAATIFCGMLFPALGFLNVYPMRFSYVADHFQYHASIALIALIAAGLCRYAKAYGRLVLIPLAIITCLQTPIYSDAETLWRQTLARNDKSWMVVTNLGKVLVARGEATQDESALLEADELYHRALELEPRLHDTHTNYGMALGRLGRNEEAIEQFQQALAINPHFAPAYYGMGQVYEHENRADLAKENYLKSLELEPQYPNANFRLGLFAEREGRLPEAADYYRNTLAVTSEDALARYNLGNVLIHLRAFPEAVYNLLQATRIRPNWPEAWTNLGAAQLGSGHPEDAVVSFQRALQLKPDLQMAQIGLQQASAALARMRH